MSAIVFFGESTCSHDGCNRKAYYKDSRPNSVFCGFHASKSARTKLKKNPNAATVREEKLATHRRSYETAQEENKRQNRPGQVICCQMKMFSGDVIRDGFLSIFPNYRHADRKDGLGMPSLSPKSFECDHGQPGLPVAKSLENFHQGNKVFASHVDEKGHPTEAFFESQRAMYTDETPHRHRKEATAVKGKRKNVPEFSVWTDQDGVVHHLTYLESRELYCTFYERHVLQTKDYATLKKLIEDGMNLMICGYDGYPVTKSLLEHYDDASRPFGHELVLYTLLTTPSNQAYPWQIRRKYLKDAEERAPKKQKTDE
jgi:hypothetical protein